MTVRKSIRLTRGEIKRALARFINDKYKIVCDPDTIPMRIHLENVYPILGEVSLIDDAKPKET